MSTIRSMLKERRFQSVFFKNLLTIFFLLFVPVLILLLITVFFLNKTQKEALLSQGKSEMIRISAKTDTLLLEQFGATYSLGFEDSVVSFSDHAEEEFTPEKLERLKRLQEQISASAVGELPRSIQILFRDQRDYFVTAQTALFLHNPADLAVSASSYDRYRELSQQAGTMATILSSGEYITFFAKSSAHAQGDIFCFIDIAKNALSQYLKSESAGSGALIAFFGEDGAFLSGSIPRAEYYSSCETGTIVKQGGTDYILIAEDSAIPGFSYLLLYPCEDFVRIEFSSSLLLVAIVIVLLITIVIVSWRISLQLYRPIQIITRLLENPEQGTMDFYRTYCRQYDEMQLILTLIESSYFRHLATSKELEKQNRLLQSAQNYSLAVQMNPHFIFNTLDSINWSVLRILKGENEISSALTDFSKIMRYALNKKGLVRFSEELECAQIYVRLRNTLSISKFIVNWDISNDILDVSVPFLIIQPILENAVTHGLRGRKEQGEITVRAAVENETAVISVEDNGSGFPAEKLAETKRRMEQDVFANESVHLGIVNTHNRIRLTYGNEWGISILSEPGKTRVSIRFPKDPPKEMNEFA